MLQPDSDRLHSRQVLSRQSRHQGVQDIPYARSRPPERLGSTWRIWALTRIFDCSVGEEEEGWEEEGNGCEYSYGDFPSLGHWHDDTAGSG